MSTDDKIVTHEDLEDLRTLRQRAAGHGGAERIADRLIAAVEADKPALPEGWVLLNNSGKHRVLWHDGTGYLRAEQGGGAWSHIDECVGELTPLATAASLIPEHWTLDRKPGLHGDPVIWAENDVVLRKSLGYEAAFEALAGLVLAAQAERGQA